MRSDFGPKLLLLIVLSVFIPGMKTHAQFLKTIDRYTRLNLLRTNEQVYMQTDREVYSPGDTIWFKAYIRNKASLQKSKLSEVFFIYLLGKDGYISKEEKVLIMDSQAKGFLVLDKKEEAGEFKLVAYSSWMENFPPEELFQKRILIQPEPEEVIRFVPYYNKGTYLPGDSVIVMVKSFDQFNKEIDGSRFRYKFICNEGVEERGGGITSIEAEYPISFVLPDSTANSYVLRIWNDDVNMDFSIPVNTSIDIGFFPEGGSCLEDKINKIAFKATYSSGQAADIEGNIIEKDGTVLSIVKTTYMGMGRFPYSPGESSRFLKITKPEGYNELYKLPDGEKNAWTIQTQSKNEKIFVNIETNSDFFDTCLFVVSIRGYACFYKLIPSESHSAFWIPTAEFPAGIAVLTLLSKENIPLAERLVFFNQGRFIHPKLSTPLKKYLCRDSVILEVDLGKRDLDITKGQYSISFYDATFGSTNMIDEPNIISSYYLFSEIKGDIANPNYYFQSGNDETINNLDLLLMTQGWRKYTYLEDLAQVDTMKLPGNRDIIKGNITRFKFAGNPYPTPGEILVYFAGNSTRIKTDENGNFSIIPEYTSEHKSSIVLSAKDNKDSEKVYLSLNYQDYRNKLQNWLLENPEALVPKPLSAFSVYEDLNRKLNLNMIASIWIDEVSINKKLTDEYEDPEIEMFKNLLNSRSATNELLHSSMDINELLINMGYNCMDNGEILTIYFQGSFVPVKFIIDGVESRLLYSDILSQYPTDVLANVYTTKGTEAFMIYNSYFVVYLQTDTEKFRAKLYESKIENSLVIPGLQIYKEFYSPRYSTPEEKKNPEPDLRKTLLWEPDLKIAEDGTARVKLFNSDRYGKVKCVLEGMSESGVPVYGETSYSIATYRE